MKNLDSIYKVVNLILKVIFLIMLAVFLLSKPATDDKSDFIKAEAVNTNHFVSNESTLAGVTWIGVGGKIGYMGSNDKHDSKNLIVNAYIDDSGNLVLIPLHGDPIIFGGAVNEN